MMLQNLLKHVLQQQGSEMVLSSKSAPRMKKRGVWVPFAENISAADIEGSILSMLTAHQQSQLNITGEVLGYHSQSGIKFSYHVQKSLEGYFAALTWMLPHVAKFDFWGFPKWVSESLARSQGLHVLIGKSTMQNEAAATAIVEEVNKTAQKLIYWKKNDALSVLKSDQSLIVYANQNQVSESFDTLVFEGLDSAKKAYELAQAGRSVLLILNTYDSALALKKIGETIGDENLADVFRWVMNVKLIDGIEGLVGIYDLMGTYPELKSMIAGRAYNQLTQILTEKRDYYKEGTRSMNHSLMQMMMKRKIDLKQGFQESPNPEELDQMLKKVGF